MSTAAIPPAPPAAVSAVPIEVGDELAAFPTRTAAGASVAVDPAGTVVLAEADAVVALDPQLHERWRLAETHASGLLVLGADRLIVATIKPANAHALELVDHGRVIATATFAQHLGESCSPANRYWLAREGDAVIALVSCGRQLVRARIALDLSSATRATPNAYAPVFAPEWTERDATLARGAQTITLAAGTNRSVLSIAPSAAGLIAAASGHELGSDPAIYTSRGSVVLAGVWQHDLGLATPTIDPIHVDAVASGDAVFVALDFGRDGRMLATNVPAVRALEPAHPAFADLGRTIAVAELDPTSGEPRAIQVLRPRTWWWTTLPWQGVPHALAVTHDLVITASDELIRIFPRRGRRVAQATPSELPTLPPIEREPPIDAAAVTEATPMWSELCAARKPHAKNAPCNLASVSLGRDGTVAIGGGYYDINQLGTHVLPKAAFETALFAAYDPRGHARWVKTAGSSWHNAILHVLARDDGRVVVLGYHGQGFAIDGTRVPDRALASNDNAFEVVIGFVAIFDPAGRLELVEDLDTVAYGDRSEDLHRSCMGTLAQGAAADEAWIVALCPHDSFRIHVHGASVSPAQSLGALGALGLFFADAAGRAVVSYPTETRDLLTFDGTRATRTPLIAGSDWNPSPIATSPSATWFATTTGRGETERIVMTSVAANLHETAFELAVGSGFTLSGLSVDEDGRPILAIRYTTELVIGGVRLAGTAWDTRTQGFAFVRLSADGRKIDHVFVAPLDPSGCSHASHGTLTSFVARAQRIVLVFAFGVENRCATDEPSTVMVLATP